MTQEATPPGPSAPGPRDTFAAEGVALVRERCDVVPAVAVVLGSGLGQSVAEDVDACHEFAYEALPGFPPPTVPGHAGRLSMGTLYGVPTAVFLGRVHLYEGHGIAATTLVTRLSAALGARCLVLTNAAGGLRPGLREGQLMLITDHLNMLGVNPLSGWCWPDGTPAFVDLSSVYDEQLRAAAERAATDRGVEVAQGVYVALPGPSYETPAEIRFLAGAGADAVGMSTVPEAAAAAALGLPVLGISCITNVAGEGSSHQDVLETARAAARDLRAVLRGVLPSLVAAATPESRPTIGGHDHGV